MSKDKKKSINFGGLLNLKEAAELLRCCPRTLKKHLSTKRVPGKIFAKKFGHFWLIQRKDIYNFLNEENNVKD